MPAFSRQYGMAAHSGRLASALGLVQRTTRSGVKGPGRVRFVAYRSRQARPNAGGSVHVVYCVFDDSLAPHAGSYRSNMEYTLSPSVIMYTTTETSQIDPMLTSSTFSSSITSSHPSLHPKVIEEKRKGGHPTRDCQPECLGSRRAWRQKKHPRLRPLSASAPWHQSKIRRRRQETRCKGSPPS